MNNDIRKSINKAFLKIRPAYDDLKAFKESLSILFSHINESESEEFHKNIIADFLKNTYYGTDYFINTKGRADLVIHTGKNAQSTVGVILEVKSPTNKAEMITTENLNAKAFQELVLYYFRERKTGKNFELKHLIVTNLYEWFIFDAALFEKLFYSDKELRKNFEDFENKCLSFTDTDSFYKEIAQKFIIQKKDEIEFTYFDLREYKSLLESGKQDVEQKLIPLYKIFSPTHLLKLPFASDNNYLNKEFYNELLHIIGLTEKKIDGKNIIERKAKDRNEGSLIENTIDQLDALDKISRLKNPLQYGNTREERLFNVALDLVITWVNRILFMKLLEAQLLKYQKGNKDYAFLTTSKLKTYDEVNALFFHILARKTEDRRGKHLEEFSHVPYLNSSLFEPTDLEQETLFISNLLGDLELPVYPKSVLQGKSLDKNIDPLEYFLRFLDAYNFSSESSEVSENDNKALISASVLGLIFEKINGYKDGSFFTPSSITMYMCKETISKVVLEKFNTTKNWNCTDLKMLGNKIEDLDEANRILNTIKLCDPAVGSGHFLVSALNELISVKNELGILVDRDGKRLKGYTVEVVNDELQITNDEYHFFEYEPNKKESQRIQETFFHEKQTIIENCLFGVDINPNSVKICRLRLWIELLKNSYYKQGTKELETLPNIDINIKCGNSLISRFALDADVKNVLKKQNRTIVEYRNAVQTYHNAESKEQKREMERLIYDIKNDFETEIAQNDPRKKRLADRNGELFKLLNQTQLFEDTKAEQKLKKQKQEKLEKEIQKLTSELEAIENNRIFENAFEWRFEFPEVLDDEGNYQGFDVIIGNPPYIRIQGLKESNPDIATQYEKTYISASGSYDIYALFAEKSLSLIKEKGIISFIMPVKWTNAAFGKGLRSVIIKETAISKIINLSAFQVFDASTYTGLQWFQKGSKDLDYLELNKDIKTDELGKFLGSITESNFHKIPINNLTDDAWVLSGGTVMAIIDKLNKHPRRISDVFEKIFQGLATSKDDVYFLYNCSFDETHVRGYSKQISEMIKIEKDLVKPLLKGEDVHRYEDIKTDRVVIFPYKLENDTATLYSEDEIASNFPLGYAYLKQCEDVLRGREKGPFLSYEKLPPFDISGATSFSFSAEIIPCFRPN